MTGPKPKKSTARKVVEKTPVVGNIVRKLEGDSAKADSTPTKRPNRLFKGY